MINALSGLLYRDYTAVGGLFRAKSLLNFSRTPKSLKLFCISSVNSNQRYDGVADKKRELPNLFYIQNPVTWLINKIDFIMLRSAWDPEFDEQDFKYGVKQAVSIISILISKNLWNNLRGLLTSKTLARLQRDVEVNWSGDQRKNIAIHPSDIKLVLPRKVHFLRIADQRFVDVDMVCVAVKFRDQQQQPQNDPDILLIEILARFHRNYTIGQLPNWTITLFKVSYQNVKNKD